MYKYFIKLIQKVNSNEISLSDVKYILGSRFQDWLALYNQMKEVSDEYLKYITAKDFYVKFIYQKQWLDSYSEMIKLVKELLAKSDIYPDGWTDRYGTVFKEKKSSEQLNEEDILKIKAKINILNKEYEAAQEWIDTNYKSYEELRDIYTNKEQIIEVYNRATKDYNEYLTLQILGII